MVESRQMSRGHGQTEETIGLLCVDGFMIMKVERVGQASPEHKDHSQQVRYRGRLPGAEAASVCDSTIIHQDA